MWRRTLLVAIGTGLFGSSITLLFTMLRPNTPLADYLTPLGVAVSSGISLWLVHHGRVRSSVLLFALAVWLAQTSNALLLGQGIYNQALVFQIVPILMMGIFVSWRMGVVVCTASIALVLWLAITVPPPSPLFDPLKTAVSYIFLYLVSLGFSYIAALGPRLIIKDIHDMRTARLASEAKYKRLTEISPVGIFRLNKFGECLFVNQRWCDITGMSAQDALGFGWHEALHPADRDDLLRRARARSLQEASFTERFRFLRPDGRVVWVIGQTNQERDEHGRLVGFIGTVTDVSNEEQALQTLRQREKVYSYLVETVADGVAISDANNRYVYVNDQFCAIVGYSRLDLLGYQVDERMKMDPQNRQLIASERQKRQAGQSSQYELTWINGRGQEVTSIVNAGPWQNAQGEFIGTIAIITDITQRKQSEIALRKSETLYRTLVETMYEAVAIQDTAGNYVYCNDQHCDLLGATREELIGQGPVDLLTFSPAQQRVLMQQKNLREKGIHSRYELTFTRRDGVEKTVIVAARPLFEGGEHSGAIIVSNDITERVRTEQALRQTQKLESLGMLAGGVAHDFNNLLVAMLGQSSLALRKLEDGRDIKPHLEKVRTAAERAADLTKQLLAYSGQGHFQIQALNINDLIKENLHLFAVAIPRHVALVSDLEPSLPPIEADAGQIQQIVMNLIINGAEACPAPPVGESQQTGRVLVQTQLKQLTEIDNTFQEFTMSALSPGSYVCLKVIDNGSGMSPETLNRVFDPFFTTKPTGRGLGLAAVLGIVRGHGGGLRVFSTPEEGTTFQILLPALVDGDPVSAISPTLHILPENLPHTVLIIDDEPSVREAAADILQDAQVRVLMASDGAMGLAMYEANTAVIDMVLLDLTMPGLNGEETLHALRQINPDLRVVISSGYNQVKLSEHLLQQNHTSFLAKPYSATALIQAIQQTS